MRRMFVCLILLLQLGGAALAAQPKAPAPPAGMTQEQFDALVGAIGDAVAKRLKEQGTAGTGTPAAEAVTPAAEQADEASRFATDLATRAEHVLGALPALPAAILSVPGALDRSAEGGMGALAFLGLLAVAVIATLGAEPLVRLVLRGPRQRLAAASRPAEGRHGLWALLALAAIDGLALGLTGVVAYGLGGSWFPDPDPQSHFAMMVLAGLFAWRLYLYAFRIVIRPILSDARLAMMDDAGASAVFRRLSTVVLAVLALRILLRMLIALHVPQEVIASGQIIANLGIFGLFTWAAVRSREPVARWFEGLGRSGQNTVGDAVGRNWLVIAIPFFIVLVATQIYGAVSARFAVPAAMLLTVNTVIALILAETVLSTIAARLGGAAVVPAGQAPPIRLADVVVRCVRVAILIAAAVSVAQSWIVDVIGLFDASGWRELTRSSLRAGGTLFLAYVAVEFVKLATHRYVSPAGNGAVHDEDQMATASSRLATLMPLLRIALTVVILITALLIVLSELGVNITPLIAGASVLGLAVSFGSQTLVRDIVSGVFYLADDAFRVGEYIDCGKAKGTVEGFTLRSIRLRHQNGQVHTIPFGQLGQITNFSRDWTTVKFNLKLARDTDLEKLRKVTKKIGQEMMENEEIKGEVLEPLKMQGIADILENALVVRFKFTVKPGKPTYIQREAIKRMVRAYQEQGIQFANALVSVQTMGAGSPEAATSAAAAAQAQIDRLTAAAAQQAAG